MSWLHPVLDELPTDIAVFPLPGALLLPHGKLPLNIFEPRYLAMVEDSLANKRMFGMIQPNALAPAGETGPGIYRVGCLGRLTHFTETDDGRYLITLTGIARFIVQRELPLRHGYRRVGVSYTGFNADLAPPTGLEPGIRADILSALRPYFAAKSIDANWDAVEAMPDGMLVTTLSMLCPFDTAEKQALLEAPTGLDRAADLVALLRMSLHELGGTHQAS